MAKRFTDTEKWKKPFLRGLNAPLKLFWLYLVDDCDHAGIWQVDMVVANLKLGENISEEEALKAFGDKLVVFDEGTKWFIPSFIEFQYPSGLSETNKAHVGIIKTLNKYNLTTEIKGDLSPLQGAKDKDKDKEEGIGNGKGKRAFETFNKNDAIRMKWNSLKKSLADNTLEEVKLAYAKFIEENRPELIEPYASIWNQFAHENGLNQIEQATDARIKKIKLRVNEQGFDFFKILQGIKKSKFAKGDNNNGWKVDFDFIIHSQDNYVKILEGKFN